MYVQLFIFTRLTTGMSKHFCPAERDLLQERPGSAFLQAGRLRVEKTSNTQAFSLTQQKRGFFFFFFSSQYLTIFPQHTSTQTRRHTPAHTQFVVIIQLLRWIPFPLIVFSVLSGHARTYWQFSSWTLEMHCSRWSRTSGNWRYWSHTTRGLERWWFALISRSSCQRWSWFLRRWTGWKTLFIIISARLQL